MIEELQADNGWEGVPKPILAKIADLQLKLCKAESNYKTSQIYNRVKTNQLSIVSPITGCLPFSNLLRSSFIFKFFEVVSH